MIEKVESDPTELITDRKVYDEVVEYKQKLESKQNSVKVSGSSALGKSIV